MVTTIFWDLGGVMLTNGWDRGARRRAAERFGLDVEDVEDRHEQVVGDFETGRMTLEAYLERTVFFEPRQFDENEFRAFMLDQSRAIGDTLEFVRSMRAAGRQRQAALNNESLELNRFRIDRFRLRECFSLFFSSCYVRLRKPDPAIYRLALDITQTPADAALLVDDRAINVEAARRIGMQTVRYRDLDQLRACLSEMNVV